MNLQENLTKENFWDAIIQTYPRATKLFCDWIDEYKKEIDWDDLFGGQKQRKRYWPQIKFHHLPYAMQQGIWIEFVGQKLGTFYKKPVYWYSGNLQKDIKMVFI